MIPISWQKTSDATWKGPDDACARILVSMQPDCKTVRGYTVELSGPLRETREEAIRDVERTMWAFERAPDRERLAKALHDADRERAGGMCQGQPIPAWEDLDSQIRGDWTAIADTALCMVPALTTSAELIGRNDLALTLCNAFRAQQHLQPCTHLHLEPGAWLAVADEALRAANVDASDNDAWPPGWQDFGNEYVWTSGHDYAENPRVPASPSGRLAARILSGQQVSTEDASELRFQLDKTRRELAEARKERDNWQQTAKKIDSDLTFNLNLRYRLLTAAGYTGTDLEAGVRHVADLKSEVKIAGDRLAVVGRKIAQVEHERDEARREIKIAHETLDTANVPRMAGTLSDRIRRLDERLELQRREKHSARTERDLLRQELQHARAETRVAAVRGDLIADYEARIGALEAINQRKIQAIALLSYELAEALGVKKVTS